MHSFVMAALKPLIICSKSLQNSFLLVQHPENRVWGPTTDHSGPKNTVLGYKMAFFGHFWAQKRVFFVMAAPKHSITCCKILQNTSLGLQHPQNRVGGPTTAHSGPKNTVSVKKWPFLAILWQKMRFF